MSLTNTTKVTSLRLYGEKDIRIDSVDAQPCGKSDVRVKIAFCGICGSDLHEYASPVLAPKAGCRHEHSKVELPITMGHEMSGTIIELGEGVKGLEIGAKVAINPCISDRNYGAPNCTGCASGRTNICSRMAYYGISGPGGGLSDQIVVNAMNVFPLPDSISLQTGALVEPLSVAWHCIRVSGFERGQDAVVLGAGPIGLALVLILRIWGARSIIVSEVLETRSQRAKAFGADHVINPMARATGANGAAVDAVAAKALEIGAGGADVCWDATGLQATLDTAIASVKPGGTIFNVAIHEKPLLINPNDLSTAEKKYTGGICYTDDDYHSVIAALADGSLKADSLITSVIPLANAIDGGFLELIGRKKDHIKILVQPGVEKSDG